MKVVVKNEENIKEDEITRRVYRSRAVILNSNNELLLGLCSGIYQFPGGHKIEGETNIECLKREVKEETGIELKEDDFPKVYQIKEYKNNYPNNGDVTYTEFNFYLIKTDLRPNPKKTNMDEYEMENNYKSVYVKLPELCDLLDRTINDHKFNKTVHTIIKDVVKELNLI